MMKSFILWLPTLILIAVIAGFAIHPAAPPTREMASARHAEIQKIQHQQKVLAGRLKLLEADNNHPFVPRGGI